LHQPTTTDQGQVSSAGNYWYQCLATSSTDSMLYCLHCNTGYKEFLCFHTVLIQQHCCRFCISVLLSECFLPLYI